MSDLPEYLASVSTKLNPLVDKYLSSPLTFSPAKRPDPLSSSAERPLSYIVLTRKKAAQSLEMLPDQNSSKSANPVPVKAKPRSMAEAVAAYTGKKFLSKKERKSLIRKQMQQPQNAEEEDVGENVALPPMSISEDEFQSASEFPDSKANSDNDVDESNSSDIMSNNCPESKVEPKKESPTSTRPTVPLDESVAEMGAPENSEEDDFDHNNIACSGSEVSSPPPGSPSSLETLKHDLKKDAYEAGKPQETEGELFTPPTLPEDEQDTKNENSSQTGVLQSTISDKFFDFGQNPDDRGSNGSTRIYKNWREMKHQKPMGLLNHGVICYMNSALQAFIHIPAIQHYFNDIYSKKHDLVLTPRLVSHTILNLSRRMWGMSEKSKSNERFINPKKLVQRLDDINCMMSEWQQEDSHEYFMSLMSRLQEDSTPKGRKLNESVIYDVFGGLLDQRVTCLSCKNVSKTKQEFYDLSLGLSKKKIKNADEHEASATPETNRHSIEKLAKLFFSNETIKPERSDASTGYYCENCKLRTTANKISFIARSPETLTIHLKRFKFDGNSSSKMKQSISYSKYLDLTKYTVDKAPTMYRLVSVIVHEGRSLSLGHYITHTLQPDETWATYDDEYINKINERDALSDPAAYVLIYSKLTPKTVKRGGDDSVSAGSALKKRKIH